MTFFGTVVVGAGHAGTQLVVSLRQGGYRDGIALVGREPVSPYDRPALSKAYLRGEVRHADIVLRSDDYWPAHGVTLMSGRTVVSVDPGARAVVLDDGRQLRYEHLVWAAGGSPRVLPVPGGDLDGVLSLRGLADADALRAAAATSRRAVIVGGGHVGLEVAAAFRGGGIDVTVVEVQERLLARVTGPEVSEFYAGLHRRAGVDIRLGASVVGIAHEGERARGVVLADGTVLPADVVVVGVGIAPTVEPLAAAGVSCGDGVDVDTTGRTGADGVYAIGDCANRPLPLTGGARVRLESVPNATNDAKQAADALLGRPPRDPATPWFWSHQYDVKLQTVGLVQGYDEAVVRGDVEAARFSVVYLRDGRIVALDCVNTVRDFSRGKHLVGRGVRTDAATLRAADDLKDLLEPVALR